MSFFLLCIKLIIIIHKLSTNFFLIEVTILMPILVQTILLYMKDARAIVIEISNEVDNQAIWMFITILIQITWINLLEVV